MTAAALAFGTDAGAIEPDALPAAMWWQTPARELAQDPLGALAVPGDFRLAAEWAPLYVAKDGARFEQERRSFRLATPAGAWRGAVELGVRGSVARGGDAQAFFGAERPLAATSTLAIGHRGPRYDFGAAASTHDSRPGLALGGRAHLGPARFDLGWSLLPQTGRSVVRWDDVDVLAEGRWIDQRVSWELALSSAEAIEIALGQESLDRRAAAPGSIAAGDRIEPSLAWRASHLSASLPALGLQWKMAAEYGEGREGLRISRSGTPYATAAGPVFNGLATLEAVAPGRRLALRAWAGRWNGDARAAVALWAFEELAAIAGTRRVAHSSATLEHRGLAQLPQLVDAFTDFRADRGAK